MIYQYTVYGLRVACRFKLSDYPQSPTDLPPEVVIRKRKLQRPPEDLPQTVYKPYSVFNADFYFLEVSHIARYLVEGSDRIYLEKLDGATWGDVFTFLFDSVFTIMLIKNERFVFHASAVAFGRQAIMFCAGGGMGKSTLAASLAANRGARIIEDDKCLLQYNRRSSAFQIRNHFPFIELWRPQTGFTKKISGIGKGRLVRKNIAKFRFPIDQHVLSRATRLHKIVLINMNQMEDKIEYEQLTGIQKVQAVKNFSHLDHLVNALGKGRAHFRAISDIVKGVEVHRVSKSRTTKLSKFIKFIEDEIID